MLYLANSRHHAITSSLGIYRGRVYWNIDNKMKCCKCENIADRLHGWTMFDGKIATHFLEYAFCATCHKGIWDETSPATLFKQTAQIRPISQNVTCKHEYTLPMSDDDAIERAKTLSVGDPILNDPNVS